jgi:hypothetical protein
MSRRAHPIRVSRIVYSRSKDDFIHQDNNEASDRRQRVVKQRWRVLCLLQSAEAELDGVARQDRIRDEGIIQQI